MFVSLGARNKNIAWAFIFSPAFDTEPLILILMIRENRENNQENIF